MNNLTFGDPDMGYYETIAGGAGAGPGWNGRSGVHTHMTNTRITDPGDSQPYISEIPVHLWSCLQTQGRAGKAALQSMHAQCALLMLAVAMQRYWRGGTQWCCMSSPCGLALEEQASIGEAMGWSGRWVLTSCHSEQIQWPAHLFV